MSDRATELVVTHRIDDDGVVMTVAGELDAASADQLEHALEQLRPLPAPLVVDLSAVPFIDSAGLRALLAMRRSALDDLDVPIRLEGLGSDLYKLFELCGLVEVFGLDSGRDG